jgi:hypothetical protein
MRTDVYPPRSSFRPGSTERPALGQSLRAAHDGAVGVATEANLMIPARRSPATSCLRLVKNQPPLTMGTCPRDAPEPPSTANDRHQQHPANMKLGRALNPRATHENTLVMRSSRPTSRGRPNSGYMRDGRPHALPHLATAWPIWPVASGPAAGPPEARNGAQCPLAGAARLGHCSMSGELQPVGTLHHQDPLEAQADGQVQNDGGDSKAPDAVPVSDQDVVT